MQISECVASGWTAWCWRGHFHIVPNFTFEKLGKHIVEKQETEFWWDDYKVRIIVSSCVLLLSKSTLIILCRGRLRNLGFEKKTANKWKRVVGLPIEFVHYNIAVMKFILVVLALSLHQGPSESVVNLFSIKTLVRLACFSKNVYDSATRLLRLCETWTVLATQLSLKTFHKLFCWQNPKLNGCCVGLKKRALPKKLSYKISTTY